MSDLRFRCKGTTKKGEHCTKGAQDNGYCRQHAAQATEEQVSVQVQHGEVTGVEPVVARRRQTRPERRAEAKRASRLALRANRRPRASGSYAFSKPPTLCHEKPMPRGIDLQVKIVLQRYRTWVSPKTHAERQARTQQRLSVMRANEKAAQAR